MAQAKSSQSNPSKAGSSVRNRGTSRGSATASSGSAAPPPVMPSVGGRGRRTNNPFTAILHFIHDVRSELRKVAWPTQRETVNLTIVVIALSVAMGLFLGGIDFIFQELFRWLLGITGGSA